MDVSLRLKDPKGQKGVGKSFVEESKVRGLVEEVQGES